MLTSIRNLLIFVLTVQLGVSAAIAAGKTSTSLFNYDDLSQLVDAGLTYDELYDLVDADLLDEDAMMLAEVLLAQTKGLSGTDLGSGRITDLTENRRVELQFPPNTINSLSGTDLGSGRITKLSGTDLGSGR